MSLFAEVHKYGPGPPRLELWVDDDAIAYLAWQGDDGDDMPVQKPPPTVVATGGFMDGLVVKWLEGPPGPAGPMGAMGASG